MLKIISYIITLPFTHIRAVITLIEGFLPSMPVLPVIVISYSLFIYQYGHHKGVESILISENKAIAKMDKKHEKNQHKNDGISGSELDKRLLPYYRD